MTLRPALALAAIALLAVTAVSSQPARSDNGSALLPAADPAHPDLLDPAKQEIAMQIVSSAENSTLNWKGQYSYIEDIKDGRGYTAGIIGFCSGTGDMLRVVRDYTARKPDNVLARYLPSLETVNGTASHKGLDPGIIREFKGAAQDPGIVRKSHGAALDPDFIRDWKRAAQDPVFREAQDAERDKTYFLPAITQGRADGLHALGQFIYYDALVMHGSGPEGTSFENIRKAALSKARPPAQGGDEAAYLNAFLNARIVAMKTEEAHSETSRVDTAQRVFVQQKNFDLALPLSWKVYGDSYTISK